MKVYRFGGGSYLRTNLDVAVEDNVASLDDIFSFCFPFFVAEEGDLNTWNPTRLYVLSNTYF